MSHTHAISVNKSQRIIWAVLAVLVFAADRVTKAAVEKAIPEYRTVQVVPNFLNFIHTKNPGAAFGMFSNLPAPWRTLLLIVVSSLLLAIVVVVMWRTQRLRWETGMGLALILGGALSNLYDRVRLGRVLDFIDVYCRNFHWATFNFADSAIVVGAGLLMFQILFLE